MLRDHFYPVRQLFIRRGAVIHLFSDQSFQEFLDNAFEESVGAK
jgi:hypothetical protein